MMQAWIERLRAPSTRRMYGFYLKRFLAFYGVTPEESLTWSVNDAEDRLEEWKFSLIADGLAGKTVQSMFGAVKRWFKDHRIRVEVSARDLDTGRTYLDYIPTRKDVQALLDGAKLHHKVCIALMAFSGLRPVDVAALKYENVKASLEAGDEVLTLVLKQKKTRDWYFTFLSPQGTRYIKALLWQRERWENFSDDTKVVAWEHEPLSAGGVRRAIERVIARTVGNHPSGESFRKFRPYGLRKYFRRTITQLGPEVAEFLMGHRSGVESLVATYSGLRDMDPAAIANLKKEYVKVMHELETEITDTTLRAQLEEKEKREQKHTAEVAELRTEIDEMKEFLQELKKREP
jgi:integrase